MSEYDDVLREKLDMIAKSSSDKKQLEDFLERIQAIESSGGKDTDHRMMTEGMHAGQAAMGRYGLMPNTVKELANRAKQENSLSKPVRSISSLPPDQMKAQLEANPQIEEQLARQLGEKVLDRQQDPEKAAYSWLYGHNLSPEQVEERKYAEDPYVQKFKKIKDLLGK